MVLTSLNAQFIVGNADNAVDNADLLLFRFQNRTLLNVQLHDCADIIPASARQRFGLIACRQQRLAKRYAVVTDFLHILFAQCAADGAAALAGGGKPATFFLHQADDFQTVVWNEAGLLEVSQRCNAGNDAQRTVIFSAVLHGVQMGPGQYGPGLLAGKSSVHIADGGLTVFQTQPLDPFAHDLLCGFVFRGIGCTPDLSVNACCIGKLAEHLFNFQSGFVTNHYCRLISEFVFFQSAFSAS